MHAACLLAHRLAFAEGTWRFLGNIWIDEEGNERKKQKIDRERERQKPRKLIGRSITLGT